MIRAMKMSGLLNYDEVTKQECANEVKSILNVKKISFGSAEAGANL